MAYAVAFGSGGTSTNGASFSGGNDLYMIVGAASSGNPNLAGSNVYVSNGATFDGSFSGVWSFSYDGNAVHMTKSAAGQYSFTRFTGSTPATIYDPTGNYTNGGFHGTYYWSTVATAPASISPSRSGRNVTVTATASSSDGGQTISSYSVEYRTSADGSTGWSAWGNTQTLSSFSYTYSSLTPALYYQFRVYANNTNGSSAATVSSNVFVSGGGKRWSGASWDSTTIAKRWDGSAWVDLTTAKRWNGSAWVDLS